MSDALKNQQGGDHYKTMKIQPVEFIQANDLGFCEGSVIKYVSRHKRKNGIEDLRKAKHFIDLLIQIEYGEEDAEETQKEDVRVFGTRSPVQ